MLRGDDVAELQQRLSALGFDTGRVDGIFGDLTSAALGEFQRNAGLPVDGIAGASTVAELLRFGTRHDDTELVTVGAGPRAAAPGAPDPGRPTGGHRRGGWARRHRGRPTPAAGHTRGPVVTTHHHPDGSIQAVRGQRGRRRGLHRAPARSGEPPAAPPPTTPATGTPRHGGRRLAELLQQHVVGPPRTSRTAAAAGCRCPLLRETRMPAVICEIGPAAVVVEQAAGRRSGRRRIPGRVGRTPPGTDGSGARVSPDNRHAPRQAHGRPRNPQPHAQVVDYALPTG